jgi:glutathione S-transferase
MPSFADALFSPLRLLLAALWPLGRFPVLVDGDRAITESSVIIEHLDLHHAGPVQLVPRDRDAALILTPKLD